MLLLFLFKSTCLFLCEAVVPEMLNLQWGLQEIDARYSFIVKKILNAIYELKQHIYMENEMVSLDVRTPTFKCELDIN
jgi:hypothetical protein